MEDKIITLRRFTLTRTKHRIFSRWECSFYYGNHLLMGWSFSAKGAYREALASLSSRLVKEIKVEVTVSTGR